MLFRSYIFLEIHWQRRYPEYRAVQILSAGGSAESAKVFQYALLPAGGYRLAAVWAEAWELFIELC